MRPHSGKPIRMGREGGLLLPGRGQRSQSSPRIPPFQPGAVPCPAEPRAREPAFPSACPGGASAGTTPAGRGPGGGEVGRGRQVRGPGGIQAGRAPPQSCRSACPSPPGRKARAAPTPAHARQAQVCVSTAAAARGWLARPAAPPPRGSPAPARPFPARQGRGPRRPEAPRAPSAATHLAARGSHMAGAGGTAPGPPPPREPLPGGRARRAVRKPASSGRRSAGQGRRGAAAARGGPCSLRLGSPAVLNRAGAPVPRRPGGMQPQTRPRPSFHVVARARKLSRARRRWVGGGVCHRVQKGRFGVSHHACEGSNGVALGRL